MRIGKLNFLIIGVFCLIMFSMCKKKDDPESEPENKYPVASLNISPNSGNLETDFLFDASSSTDPETASDKLEVKWDFEGDGTWDTDYSTSKTVYHKYSSIGTYYPEVLVKDKMGLTNNAIGLITVENVPPTECPESISDSRDGKVYKAVKIGEQCWMAENLNIGNMIHSSLTPTNNANIEKYCYDNNINNCDQYGGLYQWDEMMAYISEESTNGICPEGWHLPSDIEWQRLEVTLGMSYEEASSINFRGTNQGTLLKQGGSSNFEAILAGYCQPSGIFNTIEEYATFSTSTGQSNLAWTRYLFINSDQILRNKFDKTFGYSVRCVKN